MTVSGCESRAIAVREPGTNCVTGQIARGRVAVEWATNVHGVLESRPS